MSTPSLPYVPAEGRKDYLEEHPFDLEINPLPIDVVVQDVRIPMRDGISLAATVYRPRKDTPVPAITTSTPYGKDNFSQWNYFQDAPVGNVPGGGFYLGNIAISERTAFEAPDPGYWVPHGYAVVLVDHPGMGKSESNPESKLPLEERWVDTMAWLENQPWCTGNVGMLGVSALCATQWIAAKAPAPRQLKAIIPWEGFNETGPGGGFGGIPETAFPLWLKSQWIEPNINAASKGPEPLLFEWKHDVASINIPALVCASFSDQELHSWDTFDAFSRMQSKDKWLYTHRRQKWGAFYGRPELELQRAFFERFLKGDESSFTDVPRVRLEINSSRFEHRVAFAKDWPIPNTTYSELYLDAGSKALTMDAPVEGAKSELVAAAPGARDNRAVFDYTFTAPMNLIGHMALSLFIELRDADDADLFVGVEKLDRNGDEVYFFSSSGGNANGPVTRGWLRTSYRKLDEARSTAWRPVLAMNAPEPIPRGEIIKVVIPLMPSATHFDVGERLRLIIQPWSLAGQWEAGESREWDTIQAGRCLVHTGPATPSQLLIPIVESSRLLPEATDAPASTS